MKGLIKMKLGYFWVLVSILMAGVAHAGKSVDSPAVGGVKPVAATTALKPTVTGKLKAACSNLRVSQIKAANGGVLPPSSTVVSSSPHGPSGNSGVMNDPACPSRCTDFGDCCVCPGDN